MEVEVRSTRKAAVTEPPQYLAATDVLAEAHAYGSGRQVCVEQEEPGRDFAP